MTEVLKTEERISTLKDLSSTLGDDAFLEALAGTLTDEQIKQISNIQNANDPTHDVETDVWNRVSDVCKTNNKMIEFISHLKSNERVEILTMWNNLWLTHPQRDYRTMAYNHNNEGRELVIIDAKESDLREKYWIEQLSQNNFQIKLLRNSSGKVTILFNFFDWRADMRKGSFTAVLISIPDEVAKRFPDFIWDESNLSNDQILNIVRAILPKGFIPRKLILSWDKTYEIQRKK